MNLRAEKEIGIPFKVHNLPKTYIIRIESINSEL